MNNTDCWWRISVIQVMATEEASWIKAETSSRNCKKSKSTIQHLEIIRIMEHCVKPFFYLPSDIPNSRIQPTGWGLTRTLVVSKQLPFWTESRPLWRTVCTMQHSWLLTAVCNQSSATAVAKNNSPSSCDAPVTWSRCFSQAVTQALSLRPLLLEQSGGDNATFSEGSLAYV